MNTTRKLIFFVSVLAVAVSGFALPAQAQQSFIVVNGRLSDLPGNALVGYRVVYRHVTEIDVYISVPSDASGEYAVSLPEHGGFRPLAVITPSGRRVALENQPLVRAVPGTRQDIQIDIGVAPISASDGIQIFPGADRLLLSFVEDAVLVPRQRYEFQLDISDFEDADLTRSEAIAAVQFERLSGVEVGARIGIGSLDTPAGDDSGLTDLDAWFKFDVINRDDGSLDLTVGTLVTLPVGDSDAGVGQDGLRSKFFGAIRKPISWGTLAAHAGFWLNEDGEIAGVPLDGQVAPAGGVAVIASVSADVVLFGEATFEGERFDGGDTDARLLGGVNWRLMELLTLRAGIGYGLTDGAPDSQFIVGFSTDF